MRTLREDHSLSHVEFLEAPCEFFVDCDGEQTASEILGDDEWCNVTLTITAYSVLKRPDMETDFYRTVIDRHANISFKYTGKYCSIEFSTSEISFTDIL